MGWQEDRAEESRWWQENFPEPTMDDLGQEQFMKNELAEMRRKREELEQRMERWHRV